MQLFFFSGDERGTRRNAKWQLRDAKADARMQFMICTWPLCRASRNCKTGRKKEMGGKVPLGDDMYGRQGGGRSTNASKASQDGCQWHGVIPPARVVVGSMGIGDRRLVDVRRIHVVRLVCKNFHFRRCHSGGELCELERYIHVRTGRLTNPTELSWSPPVNAIFGGGEPTPVGRSRE